MKDAGGELLDLSEEFKRTFEDESLGGAEKSCMAFSLRGNYHCIGLYGPLTLAAKYYELHQTLCGNNRADRGKNRASCLCVEEVS